MSINLNHTSDSIVPDSGNLVLSANVGVGTSNPLYKLHVVGSANITGNIDASNINANIGSAYLPNSGVTAGTYGNATIIPVITVDAKGRITSASNVSISSVGGTTDYTSLSNKPAINVTFTGDVTGAGNVLLSSGGTNSLSVALTVQPNSVALGTDTTGNYTNRVVPGTGITVTGTADEGNVITVAHADTSSVANVTSDNSNGVVIQDVTLGFDNFGHVTSASVVTANLDTRYLGLTAKAADSDLLDGQDSTHYLNYNNLVNKPVANIVLSGDVAGSANVVLTANSAVIAITTTIQPNSVALGTDTTGNYTARVVGGTGITATGTADEGNVITVGLTNTSVIANTYGNATVVPVITVDAQGRITSASNVAISAGSSNYNDLTNKPAANVNLTGFVSGSSNVVLGSGTNLINITTVKANTEFYFSNTAPSPAVVGDRWVHGDTGILYQYINDGNSLQWVDVTNYSAISTTPQQTVDIFSPFLLMGA